MPNHTVSIVAIDTAFHQLSNLAIQRTIKQLEVREVLYFSDKDPLLPGSKYIEISPITNKDTYNLIVTTEVARHITTTHALIVQYDGFALDGNLWEDEFFKFDYIGAPWPNYPFYKVGNGGFSLRTKRLLDAAAELAHFRSTEEPEDLFIGRTIRPLLERRSHIAFPNDEVALRFAFESPGHPKQAFGFHGVLNLAIAYKNDLETFFELAPAQLISSRTNELSFGANFLSENQRNQFYSLLADRLPPRESQPNYAS